MGLTSNQIASLGNIIPSNKDIKIHESSPTTIIGFDDGVSLFVGRIFPNDGI